MEQFCEIFIHHGVEYDVWYKIVDEINGELKTLFHGMQGSRKLPYEQWLIADIKEVSDGKGTVYISGFHIMPTFKETEDYLTRFKNIKPKRIVQCIVKSVRPKIHSRHRVYLSEMIYILPKGVKLKKRELL